jgi:dephospho-CoA kinase
LLKVGLTGGIAAGKSTVGAMFAALGAHVIQADQISHQLMLPGQPVYEQVVSHFGREILDPDGAINRAKLAEIVFDSSHPRILELNRIVHPAVVRRQDEWMEQAGKDDAHAIAVVEAALLLEAGAKSHFDRLVVVTCQPEQRIERWARRTGVDEPAARREVTRRMQAQWPDEEKIQAADEVIDNSGSPAETEKQARAVFDRLAEQARRS